MIELVKLKVTLKAPSSFFFSLDRLSTILRSEKTTPNANVYKDATFESY